MIPFKEFSIYTSDGAVIEARKESQQTNRKIDVNLLELSIVQNEKKVDISFPISRWSMVKIKNDGVEEFFRGLDIRRRNISEDEKLKQTYIKNTKNLIWH